MRCLHSNLKVNSFFTCSACCWCHASADLQYYAFHGRLVPLGFQSDDQAHQDLVLNMEKESLERQIRGTYLSISLLGDVRLTFASLSLFTWKTRTHQTYRENYLPVKLNQIKVMIEDRTYWSIDRFDRSFISIKMKLFHYCWLEILSLVCRRRKLLFVRHDKVQREGESDT